jgi:acyl-CoA reductase-like NAD-dependent aldehyde dehydrogenase
VSAAPVVPPFAAESAACRAAQRAWAALSVRDRLRPVRELRHLLVDRAEDLFAAEQADVGRSSLDVLATELLPAASALKFLQCEAARVLAPRKVSGRLRPTWLLGCRDVVYRRPWGVVGVIGTWNYPVYLNVGPIAAALTAGNGVLWKPSENAPRTAELIRRLFLEAGFPPDLLILLPATREAGPLVAEADVDHVVFTGSDTVGRRLASRLGERLIPSTLELSGCDPMVVLADADVRLAADAAWFGLTMNRGQTCIAVRRAFVQRGRYAAFAERLGALAAGAKPVELVTESQRAQAERLVTDAIERGARFLPSPARGEGWKAAVAPFGAPFPPTVLLDCTPEMAICREASFAPLCAVVPFDTVDDAVSLALRCPFGLSASVFTADVRAAEELAARIPTGSVVVNDLIASTAHPATPFGGRGASGWGVTQGPDGLLAMTVPQAVSVRRWGLRPHIDEAVNPDPEATADVLRGLLRASHARGMRAWLGGVWQMVRGLRRKKR